MKLPKPLLAALFVLQLNTLFAQVSESDSLALVDLYNSTDGPHWHNNSGWLTSTPARSWYGVYYADGKIEELSLPNNNMTGTVPVSLANIKSLDGFSFFRNNLTGSLKFLEGMPNLVSFDLSENQFTGGIPEHIDTDTNLQVVYLYKNNLTDSLPKTIGKLTKLTYIDLSDNFIGGSIPHEIGNMTSLNEFRFERNNFSGSIPEEIGNLKNIATIRLASNKLTGQIPASLSQCSGLFQLDLGYNNLTGGIPVEFESLLNLNSLGIYNNNFNDTLPAFLGNLPILTHLDIDSNHFYGTPPITLLNLTNRNAVVALFANDFTFDGVEQLCAGNTGYRFYYAPEAPISLHVNNGKMSVYAGGTLSNNTYKWYKDGALIATIVGDSTYTPSVNGKYTVAVSNAIAKQLILYSDTLNYGALPISLLSFNATRKNKSVLLTWQTTSEYNNAYFILEKSDAVNAGFEEIGKVWSKGDANYIQEYSIEDKTPETGLNYYRLKQVDKDGHTSYSKIVTADFSNASLVKIFPNPVKDKLHISRISNGNISFVSLLDNKGSIILQKHPLSESLDIDMSGLSAGIYFLQVASEGKNEVMKIIKQ